VLPFIGGMRPLIGGQSVTPLCYASVANEAPFSRRFTVSSDHLIRHRDEMKSGFSAMGGGGAGVTHVHS
jgi:hypothetical protein